MFSVATVAQRKETPLDVSTQAALLEVIASGQQRREMGVLLISHARVLVEHWCNDLIRLAAAHHPPVPAPPFPAIEAAHTH